MRGESAGHHVPCSETEPMGMGVGARGGGEQLCSSAAFNTLFTGGCLKWDQVERVMLSDS